CPLDHQRTADTGQSKRVRIDGYTVNHRSEMWRCGCRKAPRLIKNPIAWQSRQRRDRLRIRLFIQPRLNRFPVDAIEHRRETGSKDGLPNASVCSCNDDLDAHAPTTASASPSASAMSVTTRSSTLRVNEIRNRDVPSGTVGGRIPRTS